jgi:hypothetical protein
MDWARALTSPNFVKKMASPNKLGLVLGFGVPLLVGMFIFGAMIFEDMDQERITAEGVPGTARILSYEKTGVHFNNKPQLRFQLEVTPTQGNSFELEKKVVVEPMEAPRLQVGTIRKVRYVPAEPDLLRFED